jgi:hypothetical protein
MNEFLRLALGAGFVLAVGCGSDDSGGGGTSGSCASNPASCKADETCWPIDATGHFGCIPAAAGQTQGSTCTTFVNQATCGAGLYCFPSMSGSSEGTCEPFCASGSCTGSSVCTQVTTTGGSKEAVPVCSPSGTGGTGGMGGGAGSGGSAGSSGGSAGSSGGSAGSSGGSAGAAGSAGSPADAGTD